MISALGARPCARASCELRGDAWTRCDGLVGEDELGRVGSRPRELVQPPARSSFRRRCVLPPGGEQTELLQSAERRAVHIATAGSGATCCEAHEVRDRGLSVAPCLPTPLSESDQWRAAFTRAHGHNALALMRPNPGPQDDAAMFR
jgi:hypothetical protein